MGIREHWNYTFTMKPWDVLNKIHTLADSKSGIKIGTINYQH